MTPEGDRQAVAKGRLSVSYGGSGEWLGVTQSHHSAMSPFTYAHALLWSTEGAPKCTP